MTVSEVRRAYPSLKRFAEHKARKKLKTRVTLIFRKQGRIAKVEGDSNHAKIYISSRMCKQNPLLARSAIIHELVEILIRNKNHHTQARQIQNAYLRDRGTSYSREIRRYDKPKKRSLFQWRV